MFFKEKKIKIFRKKEVIKHLALSVNGIFKWAQQNDASFRKAWKNSFKIIRDMVRFQIKSDIPVLTFNLLPSELKDNKNFFNIINYLTEFFDSFYMWDFLNKHQIKVSVVGKWYDLPNSLVESIKKVTLGTKDYDKFFVNFCINYSGQGEITDSFRVIGRKIKAGFLDPDMISKKDIKENLYSSYFIPPDHMVINSGKRSLDGFLLWDCSNTKIYFSDKLWPDFSRDELERVLEG